MKVKDLELDAVNEMINEDADIVREIIKEKKLEIRRAKKILSELEGQYNELMGMDVEDIIDGC